MNLLFPDPKYYCGMYHILNTGDTWDQYINDVTEAEYPAHDIERYSPVFLPNLDRINGHTVLDLGVNLGYTCIFASHFGASTVTGIEVRDHWLQAGRQVIDQYPTKNITLLNNDVNDLHVLRQSCENNQVVIALGLFYHLANHYTFLETICSTSTVETLILETTLPSDNKSIDVVWKLESVDDPLNGFSTNKQVLVGAPNIKWIETALDGLGWQVININVTSKQYWNPPRACVTAIRKDIK
jgi:2-polyprenyl-3-methyl-5-hydroxy-6-metoxy-1,4-benzoquinol methylase